MLRSPSKQNKILLGLRVLSIITCITGVGGLVWATTKEGAISTDGLGIFNDTLGAIALGISGLWSIIVIAVTVIFNDPIPPGVIIGFDAPLWALTISVGIVLASSPINQVSDLTCDGSSRYCDMTTDRTIIWRFLGTIFCLVNCICHATFVGCASKICHQRRKRAVDSDIEMKG